MQFIERIRVRYRSPATQLRRLRSACVYIMRHVGMTGRIDCLATRDAAGRSGFMLLIDTMPYDASYRKEHIPGAQQFLFAVPRMSTWDTRETDGRSAADFAALLGADKARTLVFYCGFVKCTRSDNAAA